MYYYKVNKIGDGTELNPFRPDIIEGVSFVWSDKLCTTCGTYIMASSEVINVLDTITDLQTACESRNLDIEDVAKWFAGD